MSIYSEPYVEKVQTGSIVVISGEYLPVDKADHPLQEEVIFLIQGETAPALEDIVPEWKLVEIFDFTA